MVISFNMQTDVGKITGINGAFALPQTDSEDKLSSHGMQCFPCLRNKNDSRKKRLPHDVVRIGHIPTAGCKRHPTVKALLE